MKLTHAMDPARVREVAATLRAQARTVEDLRTSGQASSLVLRGAWQGGDTEALLSEWDDLSPRLTDAARTLHEVVAALHRGAASQDATSGEGGGAPPSSTKTSAADTNPAPRTVMAGAPDPGTGQMTEGEAERWRAEHTDGVNPAWDIDPEEGTAIVSGRAVPNNDFAGRTYDGPQWSEELQERYPDGVEIDEFGFPGFYPYVNAEHGPVLIELTETSSKDIRLAYEAAGIDKDEAKALQEDWVWHHTHAYDPESGRGELVLVPRDLHAAVKHAGGRSLHKHDGAETSD